jgi:hypothetical protein
MSARSVVIEASVNLWLDMLGVPHVAENRVDTVPDEREATMNRAKELVFTRMPFLRSFLRARKPQSNCE